MSPRKTRACFSWIVAILLACNAGCNRSGSKTDAAEVNRRPVLATIYPVASLARQVAGNIFDVNWFCESGQDPRDLRLTPEQQKIAHKADLIITSGFGETWAGDQLSSQARLQRLVLPEAMPSARALPDEHAGLWLDPQIARELVDEIRERATVWDGKHEATYRDNAESLAKEIEDLDAEYRRRLAPLKGRSFVALRPLWGQLADRYNLREVAPIDATPQSLTDEDVRTLKRAAAEAKTDVLVTDANFLPGIQRELALRTGLRLMPLDAFGSSAPDGRSTYLKLMRYNLDELEKALK